MTIEGFIAQYGLLAVGLGAAFEGEAVVATGGLLAHRGLMPLDQVMLAAAAGSCMLDQLYFFLGRYLRDSWLVRRVTSRATYGRVLAMIERNPTPFILAFRFMWGLRTVSPITLGTSQVAWPRFAILNVIAAALWAVIVSSAGYLFATGLTAAGAELHRIEHLALAVVAITVIGAIVGLALRRIFMPMP
ncbi:DedA family protein [Altererythrobacter sp. FM1]|uniref:DedA family protein n=1 Tax=Tsuneonella flava TaxID=2055955 RepID=UPI000C7F828F|nr:DedA family protein [Tsuneonella flava]ROT93809.1 DedA family protein [Altererythrobacter sp. FM1]UBS33066.1 DedA family protein [Altererythrobacter sp. N1]